MITTLAEIADKVPSTAGMILCAAAAGAVCAGIAMIHRIVAWSMLLITVVAGGLLACLAFADAFVSGPFRDAVWSELGWPWVVSDVLAPLVPSACVTGVLIVRRWRSTAGGFPLDGHLSGT
jgi:hypothetical protein